MHQPSRPSAPYPSSPPPAVATSQTDPLNELNATMDRMRKVADGSIEAPPLARKDAASALAVCDSITKAPDLWDGTITDLSGYLRMMGAYINGMLRIKEVLPPMNNKPGNPVFDVLTSQTLFPQGNETKSGAEIYNIFVSGDPKSQANSRSLSPDYDTRKQRKKFESYDPAVREVVGACAVIYMSTLVDGIQGNNEMSGGMFKLVQDNLRCLETDLDKAALPKPSRGGVKHNTTLEEDKAEVAREDAKLASLQQGIKEKLGVTREELNLDDLMLLCQWRIGPSLLGIDNYFVEGDIHPMLEQGAVRALEMCTYEHPEYLPPFYDLALYMGSKTKYYTPRRALEALFRANNKGKGAPWAELRVRWIAAKATLAGALSLPEEGHQQPPVPKNHVYKFTAGQLLPHVEAAEGLLERMRPWLGDVGAFKQIDKDVKGWRESFINGKDKKVFQAAIPMGCVTSQWVARDGERQCSTCGASPDVLKVCSACRQAWYCNAACQKAGWKAHKKTCVASKKT